MLRETVPIRQARRSEVWGLQHVGDGFALVSCGASAYSEADLERRQIEVRFGLQPLESGLDFYVVQAQGLVSLHAAVLGSPLVEGELAGPAVAANVLDRQACLCLLQESNVC